MEKPPIEQPNTLKSEHLLEDISPIIACVCEADYKQIASEVEEIKETGHNIDFYSERKELRKRDYKNSGEKTYVISSVDDKPKFTEDLFNCTSLVAVGRDAISDQEISFLTHNHLVEPDAGEGYNPSAEKSFIKHLRETLRELKSRCSEGSIDIVLAGGMVQLGKNPRYRTGNKEDYKKSLEILNSIVQEVFGFDPLVICGPKALGEDKIYFDTMRRRLYVFRLFTSKAHNESFLPDQLGKMEKKWRKEK